MSKSTPSKTASPKGQEEEFLPRKLNPEVGGDLLGFSSGGEGVAAGAGSDGEGDFDALGLA